MSAQPFVTVMTPTYNRRQFIPAAIACFKAQTYPQNRMEWLVLDDGTDKVGDLFAASGLTNVRYIAVEEKLRVGVKRNRMNDMAKGEIIVCWDDDDYYPPDRVRKAVAALRSAPNKSIPVTGSSELYLYFTDRNEIWSSGFRRPYHCTGGTMAYWRSYSKDHRFAEDVTFAEERAFLDDERTPVRQLVPHETMLVICHAYNTFDKRQLLDGSNPYMKKVSLNMRSIVKDKGLRDFYLGLAKAYSSGDATAAT
jgi:glycosyltransferase involved in cell wall biosynthesis